MIQDVQWKDSHNMRLHPCISTQFLHDVIDTYLGWNRLLSSTYTSTKSINDHDHDNIMIISNLFISCFSNHCHLKEIPSCPLTTWKDVWEIVLQERWMQIHQYSKEHHYDLNVVVDNIKIDMM